MPTFTFTNNNSFGVVLYAVSPGSTQETRQGEILPRKELSLTGDFPAGTDWRIRDSTDGSLIDIYRGTSDNSQSHAIQDYRQIQIALSLQNQTPSLVYVYIVDPVSKIERRPLQLNRALNPGELIRLDLRPLFPNTEIRFKQAGGLLGISAQTLIQTYLTTAEPSQNYVIYPPAPEAVTPVVITGGTVIYSGPIENQPLDPKTHTPPIEVWSAQRSIFNAASYTLELGMFEWSIRQRTNLLDANADKNAIRAALYAGLMAIVTAPSRTDKEKAIMGWLADQIKKARIAAAQLALQEYYRWNNDPWSYQPPAGFTPYLLAPRNSPEWLEGATPYPPALDYESLISFAADIVSNNGWSPLNNPILQQGQPGASSLVGVVGFPSYGAALAYGKLYTTDQGVTALAYTTANLFSPINLSPLPPGVAAPLASLKVMNLQNIGPYTYRSLQDLATAIIKNSGGLADVPMPAKLEGLEVSELRAALNDILEAEVLGSFVCTLTLSIAIQALIDQIILLAQLSRLEQTLKDEVAKQQSAPRPDLGNLLYNDIHNIIQVYAPDYQPTDPVLLERLMGRQEVYRAFLLSTIS